MVPTITNISAVGVSSDDVYTDEYSRRRIYLTNEITPSLASDVCAQINCLAARSRDDIHLIIIECPGGSVSAGMAIYDTMKSCGCTVCTYVIGECASMAALLASSGTAEKRFIAANAEMMIHQPAGGITGSASDIERSAQHILATKKRLHSILAVNTSQPYEKICKDCERDYYLDAEEAITYGLVDQIFTGFDA